MSRRHPAPYERHGRGGKRRPGAHRHRNSPETERWNRDYLIPPRPNWADADTYRELVQFRNGLMM